MNVNQSRLLDLSLQGRFSDQAMYVQCICTYNNKACSDLDLMSIITLVPAWTPFMCVFRLTGYENCLPHI